MSTSTDLVQGGRNLYRSFSIQVLAVVALGSILPPLVYFGPSVIRLVSDPIQNSVAATTIAAILGILAARRVNVYPGVKQLSATFPAFLASFAIVAFGILSLRVEYSISVFVVNLFVTLATYCVLMVLAVRGDQEAVFAVPGGRIQRLSDVGLEIREMTVPILPQHQGAIIAADLHADHEDAWERMLANAALKGIPVFHFKQVYEAVTGRVQIEHLSENSFGSLLPNMLFVRLKRLADIFSVLVLLPLLILPLLLVALLIRLDSPGPIFFRQLRMGYGGAPFRVLKFRTMRYQAVTGDPEIRRKAAMTGDNDPRITRLGRVLRKCRVDELPQMYNILMGEMSWIGPRPEAIDLSHWYRDEIPFYDYRHIVRPGLTGWAQVNQGHVTRLKEINDKLEYDFYYIKNFSFWLDMLILARTALVVVTGRGAR